MSKVEEAVILADEYVLAHKVGFCDKSHERSYGSPRLPSFKTGNNGSSYSVVATKVANSSTGNSERICYYCKKPGHVIADCHAFSKRQKAAKLVGLIASLPCVGNHHSSDIAICSFNDF